MARKHHVRERLQCFEFSGCGCNILSSSLSARSASLSEQDLHSSFSAQVCLHKLSTPMTPLFLALRFSKNFCFSPVSCPLLFRLLAEAPAPRRSWRARKPDAAPRRPVGRFGEPWVVVPILSSPVVPSFFLSSFFPSFFVCLFFFFLFFVLVKGSPSKSTNKKRMPFFCPRATGHLSIKTKAKVVKSLADGRNLWAPVGISGFHASQVRDFVHA